MDYGIIESEANDTREPLITRFKLGELMDRGVASGVLNLALKPRDRIYVFQRSNFREQPKLTVVGSVQNPGEYEFKRNMHLADLILASGGLMQDSDLESAELYRIDYITKNVSLIKVNLRQAMAGELAADVILQDADRLVIHSIFERKQREMVSVSGEVHNPLSTQLTQDMRLADLVFAAGNVTEMAFLEKGELTRYKVVNGERRESEHFEVDLAAALRGEEAANIRLQPHDNLMVRRLAGWSLAKQIKILGEVKHPGSYPIQDGERLSAVLRRTGGYTNNAYLAAAVFTRESIRVEQQKQIDDLVRRMESEMGTLNKATAALRDATLAQHQTQGLNAAERVLAQLKEVKATGRLVIELADIEALAGSPFDIQLRDGDTLSIPTRPDEVLVLGEVYNQSALIYEPNKSRKDYLRDAGPTRMADVGESYIVRANGRIEVNNWFGSNTIRPGDTIVVPLNMSSFNMLDSILDWSRATMQIATSLATLKFVGVIQ